MDTGEQIYHHYFKKQSVKEKNCRISQFYLHYEYNSGGIMSLYGQEQEGKMEK